MCRAAVNRTAVLRLSAVVALLAALAAVAIGCGGSDDALPSDIGGVCREVADRFGQLQEQPPSSYEQAAATVNALLELADRGDEALAQLSDQAPDPESYGVYLQARAGVARRLEAASKAIDDENPRAYDLARSAANEGATKRRRLARDAGLDECARSTGI